MPHKHNADRRRDIPKMSFKLRNWSAYEATPTGQPHLIGRGRSAGLLADHWIRYSGAAIQTSR
jgi:hypothetical protein